MKVSDFDLKAVGHEVQLVGGIWAGNGRAYLCYFPEYGAEFEPTVVEMNGDDWKALLRQSDLVETEVLTNAKDPTSAKAVIRKCERNIEQGVQWAVFKRDGYACRYCGRNDVPLTVDHLVTWESGGPSTEANLLSACKACNKRRGRMPYAEWLDSAYCREKSKGIDGQRRAKNWALKDTLDSIPRMSHVRSR